MMLAITGMAGGQSVPGPLGLVQFLQNWGVHVLLTALLIILAGILLVLYRQVRVAGPTVPSLPIDSTTNATCCRR